MPLKHNKKLYSKIHIIVRAAKKIKVTPVAVNIVCSPPQYQKVPWNHKNIKQKILSSTLIIALLCILYTVFFVDY